MIAGKIFKKQSEELEAKQASDFHIVDINSAKTTGLAAWELSMEEKGTLVRSWACPGGELCAEDRSGRIWTIKEFGTL